MSRKAEPPADSSMLILHELLQPIDGAKRAIDRPDGTRLRTIEAGAGDDVLLVHGFGMSADAWSLVQPALVTRGRRVIAYDQRGHGHSSCGSDGVGSTQLRADLIAVAAAHDVHDGTLVCHSMGNFVALGVLGDETLRKRFRRAVLVNPVTGYAAKGAPVARIQGPLVQLGVAQHLARIPRIGDRLARASLGPHTGPDVVEATRRALAAIPPSASPCLAMLRRESVASRLTSVDLPLHVLTGTEDKTTPSWHAELIVARARNSRIDYIADAGHMINWEAPQAILQAVTDGWSG